jgi:cell division protein DivIC
MPPFPFDDAIMRRPFGPPPVALRLAAVLIVPFLLYALFATGQKALDNYRLNQQADGLRAEIRDLRNENIALQQQILQARTDASIEQIARQQLGLVKPGDNPLVLVAADASSTSQAQASPTPESPRPPWRQWWDYFFG